MVNHFLGFDNALKMIFFKNFSSKCEDYYIWSYLLKKFLMENFIFVKCEKFL